MGKYQGRAQWWLRYFSLNALPDLENNVAQELPEAEGMFLHLIHFLAQICPTECKQNKTTKQNKQKKKPQTKQTKIRNTHVIM